MTYVMTEKKTITAVDIKKPLNLNRQDFMANKYAYYTWLREEAPVCKGKIHIINGYFLSRYDDCVNMLNDSRFVRNRATATGGRRSIIPMPKSVSTLMNSMMSEDEPEHRRLRNLVHKAFTPRKLANLEGHIETLTQELLDKAEKQGQVDLMETYARPIPMTVIAKMLGTDVDEVHQFAKFVHIITNGFSGFTIFRTILWNMPKISKFVRQLIERKRSHPADDILTGLIQAEEDGDRLSEDELVAMVFLLIAAGHSTTYNLIINSVYTLLMYPEQLTRLRAEPALIESAIEEVLRFNGPQHITSPEYASVDVTLHGVTIPKGSTVFSLLGAANHDPEAFVNPEDFDITRSPNRHLSFGMGIHHCLGASLARMETKIALNALLERNPNLRLAVAPDELELVVRPGWHQYKSMPVILG
ncbi:cytochrome P450 [Chloroflexi bacterium TSY]|nr:cytochrome P450 [Chloroflexi bacterium TSY]